MAQAAIGVDLGNAFSHPSEDETKSDSERTKIDQN
jgi:hypothetical protein